DPVVAPLLLSLFRPQQVAAPEQRDLERALDLVEIAVRREGPIRDEDRVRLAKALLHLLVEDFLELREDDRLVHHPADRTALLVPGRAEVSRIRRRPALFADHERREH